MSVILVDKWFNNPKCKATEERFLSIDRLVRSRIIPPPLGSITFKFENGCFTITGNHSRVLGAESEVVMELDTQSGITCIEIIGNYLDASRMAIYIEAEIKGLDAENHPVEPVPIAREAGA